MEIDPEYLRSWYASLSDEALQEVDRSELVDGARTLYDIEVGRRLGLAAAHLSVAAELSDGELQMPGPEAREKPGWFDEAAEVYSLYSRLGSDTGAAVDGARQVLVAADIPCFVDVGEELPDDPDQKPEYSWRLLVPGKLAMRATNILDRDIFNEEFEALWKTHLEMLSDQEFSEAEPREIFCGLYDRIERVVKVYNDELKRRGACENELS